VSEKFSNSFLFRKNNEGLEAQRRGGKQRPAIQSRALSGGWKKEGWKELKYRVVSTSTDMINRWELFSDAGRGVFHTCNAAIFGEALNRLASAQARYYFSLWVVCFGTHPLIIICKRWTNVRRSSILKMPCALNALKKPEIASVRKQWPRWILYSASET